MFRSVFRLSSGMSIQKANQGKHNKNLSAPLVQVNLGPGKDLKHNFYSYLEISPIITIYLLNKR